MNYSAHSYQKSSVKAAFTVVALLGGLTFSSCGSAPMSNTAPEAAPGSEALVQSGTTVDATGAAQNEVPADEVSTVPRSLPQLIKTASLTITVDSAEKSVDAVGAIARRQSGDVIGLEDQTPPGDRGFRISTMQIRVPQAKLESTLDALAALGTIQHRSITAEDVSNQLVDFQARLRNLRQTEELLLGIMKRSGNVGDVLKVAQELSNVRNSIEQIDAQLTDLRNRVSYSTITVTLEEAIASTAPQRTIGIELGDTWSGATRSLREFTLSLLQIGIWLMVYSPYWLLLGAAILGMRKLQRRSRPILPNSESPKL